jgi:multidrug efflux pump subunit AcrA (membrane-fusion protein)
LAPAGESGVRAVLTLNAFPGQAFHGTIVRNANAIDRASRTPLTEVEVENPDGQLMPGTYALVYLTVPDRVSAVTVPANTLLFRAEGLRVGVVRNSQVELTPVTIGRDYGSVVEVLTGLQPTAPVIVNPADSLLSGTPVRVTDRPTAGIRP